MEDLNSQHCLVRKQQRKVLQVINSARSLIHLHREGASIWYIKQLVVSRVARFTIGMRFMEEYKPHIPEHYARRQLVRQTAELVPGLSLCETRSYIDFWVVVFRHLITHLIPGSKRCVIQKTRYQSTEFISRGQI